MDIKELKNDGLTIQVAMNFGKEDYAEKKKKALNKFRREADIKGFRKGTAPMGLIEKLHGQNALVDSINSLISENLNKYIEDNKLSIIGEPLPIEDEETKNDWNNGENFVFKFEIAPAPKVDFTLSKEDSIVYYKTTNTAKVKADYKANVLQRYAKLETCETVKEEDFIVADFEQGDKKVENTYVSMKSLAKKEDSALFLGKKSGDSMELNLVEVFPNETDRAAMLKMKKEEVASIDPMWKMTIKEVKNYVDAVPGQELYDQMFGQGAISTEEEFDAKLNEAMMKEQEQEVEYRFMLDARDYLIKKADLKLPEEFLKKWLFTINEGKFTMEDIEKDFELFLQDFRWQTIAQHIMKEQKLEVTKEMMMDQAVKFAGYQFAMYGMNNVPEEHLRKYAESVLKDEKEGRRIFEKVEQDLVINYVRGAVTLEEKKIASDKLRKMNE